MKAILEFNLPEEKIDHEYALKGHLAFIVLDEIDTYLRDLYKHQNKKQVSIEKLRDFINIQMSERGISDL